MGMERPQEKILLLFPVGLEASSGDERLVRRLPKITIKAQHCLFINLQFTSLVLINFLLFHFGIWR